MTVPVRISFSEDGLVLEVTQRQAEDLGLSLFDLASRNRDHPASDTIAELGVRILSALQIWRRRS